MSEIGVSFGNLSLWLAPSAWEKRAVISCNPPNISAQTLHLALEGSLSFFSAKLQWMFQFAARDLENYLYIFVLFRDSERYK